MQAVLWPRQCCTAQAHAPAARSTLQPTRSTKPRSLAPRMAPAHQMTAPSRTEMRQARGRHRLASSTRGATVSTRATSTLATSARARMVEAWTSLPCGSGGSRCSLL